LQRTEISNIVHKLFYTHGQFQQFSHNEVQATAYVQSLHLAFS